MLRLTGVPPAGPRLEWNQALETGGVLVGNEVKITPDVGATKKA